MERWVQADTPHAQRHLLLRETRGRACQGCALRFVATEAGGLHVLSTWRDRGLVWRVLEHANREKNLTRMDYYKKSICKISLQVGVTFRDESNDNN